MKYEWCVEEGGGDWEGRRKAIAHDKCEKLMRIKIKNRDLSYVADNQIPHNVLPFHLADDSEIMSLITPKEVRSLKELGRKEKGQESKEKINAKHSDAH